LNECVEKYTVWGNSTGKLLKKTRRRGHCPQPTNRPGTLWENSPNRTKGFSVGGGGGIGGEAESTAERAHEGALGQKLEKIVEIRKEALMPDERGRTTYPEGTQKVGNYTPTGGGGVGWVTVKRGTIRTPRPEKVGKIGKDTQINGTTVT